MAKILCYTVPFLVGQKDFQLTEEVHNPTDLNSRKTKTKPSPHTLSQKEGTE